MEDNQKSVVDRMNQQMKNSVTIRLISIAILVLLLLIPTAMIRSLISEREYRRDEAVVEISSKWGNMQTVSGLIITVPYIEYISDKDNRAIKTTEYAHFLPEKLNINGKIEPEIRYRGIYEAILYSTELEMKGYFKKPSFSEWNIPERNILWDDAFVSLGITDMRGIENDIVLKWNETSTAFNPGIECSDVMTSGVSTRVGVQDSSKAKYNFALDLKLKGSTSLYFMPFGKETDVNIISDWHSPSFDGTFLPDNRTVTDTGFIANWKVLHLNRNYPQKWRNDAFNTSNSGFGVKLFLPNDEYQKTMRSAKYAIMFISLTFLIFFFVEILNKKRIHPIQYILVGLALVLFYALLLALSEHISFNWAYIAAAIANVILITAYSFSMFRSNMLTKIMGLILLILYGFIFTTIQLQDLALLLGSIGLFIVLAIVMYLSRNIDWYSVTSRSDDNDAKE